MHLTMSLSYNVLHFIPDKMAYNMTTDSGGLRVHGQLSLQLLRHIMDTEITEELVTVLRT